MPTSRMPEFPDDAILLSLAAEKLGRRRNTVQKWAINGWIHRWYANNRVWVSRREVIACAKEQNWKRLGARRVPGWGRGNRKAVE